MKPVKRNMKTIEKREKMCLLISILPSRSVVFPTPAVSRRFFPVAKRRPRRRAKRRTPTRLFSPNLNLRSSKRLDV